MSIIYMGQMSRKSSNKIKSRKSSNKIKSRKSSNKIELHPKLKEFKNKAKVNNILNTLVSHMNALIKKMEKSAEKNNKTVLSNFKKFLKKDGERFGLKMKSGKLKHIKTSLQKGGAPKDEDKSNKSNKDDPPEGEDRLTNRDQDNNTNARSLGQAITNNLMDKINEEGLTPENLELFRGLLAEYRLQEQHDNDMRADEDEEWRTRMEWRGNVAVNALNTISRYAVGVASYAGAHYTLQLANGITGPILTAFSSICSFIFISFLGAIVDGINGITNRIPVYGGNAIEHPRDAWNRIRDEADFGDNPGGLAGIMQDLYAAGEGGYYVSFLIFFFIYLGVFSMAYQVWNSEDISMFWGFFRARRNAPLGPGQEANMLENRRTRSNRRTRRNQRTLANSNRSNSRSRTPSPSKQLNDEGKRSKKKTKKIKKKKTRNSKRNNKRRNRKQSKKKKRKTKK
jgi:hypothetical protein